MPLLVLSPTNGYEMEVLNYVLFFAFVGVVTNKWLWKGSSKF